MRSCLSHVHSSSHWCLSCTWCTRPLSRALNSAADLLVDSILEKLFHALWQKESVRHPHPFLQGMYLNFGGFSAFSSEPAGCLDAFFSLICSLQWHSTFLISGNSFLCAFWMVSSNFLRLAWLSNCFRCAFPAWPPQIIISASGIL